MHTGIEISTQPSANLDRLKVHQYNGLVSLFKVSIQVFISTAADNIAIDSGMSIHSLLPAFERVKDAGRRSQYANAVEWVLMTGRPIGRKYQSNEFPGVMDKKSPEHGRKLGEKAYNVDFGTQSNPTMYFDYNIQVLQFFLHEGQWEALEKGKEAMQAFIRQNARMFLPDVGEWLVNNRLIYGV